jgi:hypothetical protein
MNAIKMLTNKWVLGLGMALLITAAANVTLAAGPGRDGRDNGFRGDRDNGRPVYVNHDRDNGRDDRRPGNFDRGRDNNRGRFDGPAWRGGFGQARDPGFFVPTYRPPVVCGGVRPTGVQVIGGMPGQVITVIVR